MWSRGRVDATDLQALILGGLRIADLAVVVVSGIVAFWIRHDSWALPQLYGLALIAAILLTVNFMQIARVYVFEDLTRLYAQLGRTTAAWIAVLLMLLAIAFLTQTSVAFSRSCREVGRTLAHQGMGLRTFRGQAIFVDSWCSRTSGRRD